MFWMRSTWPLTPAAGSGAPGGWTAGVGRKTSSVNGASCEFASAATLISYRPFLAALNENDALPCDSVCSQPTETSCERTAWKTSIVASSAPAAARSSPMRCAPGSRRLYHTEAPVGTPQVDSRSPASVVAPTVVPLIDAGSVWIACAPASVSLAGAGTVGAGGAAPSANAPAASTMAAGRASASAAASLRAIAAAERVRESIA